MTGNLSAQEGRRVAHELRLLTAEPPETDAVIIKAGDAYAQFGLPSMCEGIWLPFEAVSDEFLAVPLTEDQKFRLTEFGFAPPSIERETLDRGVFHGVSPNWHMLLEVGRVNLEDVASDALHVLASVYGIQATSIDPSLGPSSQDAFDWNALAASFEVLVRESYAARR